MRQRGKESADALPKPQAVPAVRATGWSVKTTCDKTRTAHGSAATHRKQPMCWQQV